MGPTRPNLVFILIDDMGWRDLSCYGSAFYETPVLDELARRGMTFRNAYAACPVCSPTRASLLTGQYPARVGVTNYIGGNARGRHIDAPYVRQLPRELPNLARSLRDAGYRTWHVGKWHLGEAEFYPEHQGFDVNIGGGRWGHPPKGYFSPFGIDSLPDREPGEYLTDRLTDEAIRLIEQPSDAKPFYLNFWHYAVHTPIQSPPELVEKYRRKAAEMGLDQIQAIEEGERFPTAAKKHLRVQRRRIQSDPAYAAMVENLDSNIGRLLEALRRTGQLDNTIIIFTSDNGGLATAEGSPTCNAPLAEGKGWMYDGGVREPMIIAGPGIFAGECETPITSPDFYPTLMELIGGKPDPSATIDGTSFAPVLRGSSLPPRPIFWHYPHYGNQGGTPGSSVRDGDLKLIEFFEDGRRELYDLRHDIGEKHDLSQLRPNDVKRLHALLVQWRQDVAARIPQPNPDWRQDLA